MINALRIAAVLLTLNPVVLPAAPAQTFASEITNYFRGEAFGSLPGRWYGSSSADNFAVVPITEFEIEEAVLGAPDLRFVALPGVGEQALGGAFRGAYVEVAFDRTFDANTVVTVYETLRDHEEAVIWLWYANGTFEQLRTDPAVKGDAVSFDLRPYAGFLANNGGAFTRIGIGGLDEGGSVKGFDLDAIAISPVPEPATWMLLGLGTFAIATFLKHQRPRAVPLS
ncbi:PEP-CTERM sorting domain-containing protein [Aquincola tertiaricarbonis]|uniref:PEP-CTERM sorting domain-containing protein n=1 Tax=Aquincola tertiaricarbonis TaxID=391953 RepID=UPI000614CF0B|nr:PEP-CTERM sorting domain-containing protein [Aquincola tertiaricarbonis]